MAAVSRGMYSARSKSRPVRLVIDSEGPQPGLSQRRITAFGRNGRWRARQRWSPWERSEPAPKPPVHSSTKQPSPPEAGLDRGTRRASRRAVLCPSAAFAKRFTQSGLSLVLSARTGQQGSRSLDVLEEQTRAFSRERHAARPFREPGAALYRQTKASPHERRLNMRGSWLRSSNWPSGKQPTQSSARKRVAMGKCEAACRTGRRRAGRARRRATRGRASCSPTRWELQIGR